MFQPVTLFDSRPDVRSYLESHGILRRDGSKVAFFHGSFFDYCYARRFVKENASLTAEIKNGNQGFFERPKIIQTLTYLRGVDSQRCLSELLSLMDRRATHEGLRQLRNRPGKLRRLALKVGTLILGTPIRYHLRHLAFAWFGQQTNLTPQEKHLGISCLNGRKDRYLLLSGAVGNAEWFDVLDTRISELLRSAGELPDEKIANFLLSVQEARANRVYGLLVDYLGKSDEWDQSLGWFLNSYKAWNTENAEKCLLWFCENAKEPWRTIDPAFHYVGKANADLGCKVLKIILGRLKSEWRQIKPPPKPLESVGVGDSATDLVFDREYMEKTELFVNHTKKLLPKQTYWLEELLRNLTQDRSEEVLSIIVPWLEDVLPDLTPDDQEDGWLSDNIFSSSFVHSFRGPDRTIIESIHNALLKLAGEDGKNFLIVAERIEKSRYLVLHQMLADVLTKHASRYAHWTSQYLLKYAIRFSISRTGSGTFFSRKLIAAIFPLLDSGERGELEEKILSYCPAWEEEAKFLKFRGFDQLELLWGVPEELLTSKGQAAVGALRRKFPQHTPSEPEQFELTRVGSPIPEAKAKILTNQAWLDAMRHYDDKRKKSFLKGDVAELSCVFENAVEAEPDRFAGLTEKFDETISSRYFRALLRGLAKSGISSDVVFGMCKRFAKERPQEVTVQGGICEAVEKRLRGTVPEPVIQLVKTIALHSSDPDHEAWKIEAGQGQYYHNGDPHSNGINTVRGQAVRLFVRSRQGAPEIDINSFLSCLEQFAQDPSSAVRSCLIEVLPYACRFNARRTIRIFESAIKDRPELLGCDVSSIFIYYALARDPRRMLKHIVELTKSEKDEARESGGRLAALASFELREAKRLFFGCLKGDTSLRTGAAQVLARNVDRLHLVRRCLDGLRRLYNDPDRAVRNDVGEVFRYLPQPDRTIKKFTFRFLRSKSLVDSARNLVDYATRIRLAYPRIAMSIAELTQVAIAQSEGYIHSMDALIEDDLISLVISLYTDATKIGFKARAFDLFERIMLPGSRYAMQALQAADR